MRAIVYAEFQGPVDVLTVPELTVSDDGVLIEVHATGLCLSDWHGWAGHDEDITLPHVPGHEFAGVVTAVGPLVTRWSTGDRVTAPFIEGCGACEWCRSGNAQVCPHQQQPGFSHWGSFADTVAIHAADTNLIAIAEGVSFEAAAALGCRFATAFRALTGRAAVQESEWVTIFGAGGVGLSAVMIAKALGARVIAVDRSAAALDMATDLGADAILLAGDADLPERIRDLTGEGSHVTVDAVGSEHTASDAILSLRRRGRHVQVGLLPPVGGHPRVPLDRVIGWELDILGSHGMAARDYPQMLALIEKGHLRPELLITRNVSLADAAELLPTLRSSPHAGITIIDPRRA